MEQTSQNQTPFDKLLTYFEGSTTKAGKAFGVSPSVVDNWRRRGIPSVRAIEAETITGGHVSAREIIEAARSGEGRAAA